MYDLYTHVSNPSRDLANHTSLEPNTFSWLLAIIESSIIGIVGQAGFALGLVSREHYCLLMRF